MNSNEVTLMKPSKTATTPRKPRLLWANVYCLLDTSSGASMAVREMLIQLAKRGYEIAVLGAMVFDNPRGMTRLQDHWETVKACEGGLITVNDGPLKHQLVVTAHTRRDAMTAKEEEIWFGQYRARLHGFKPDLVYYYGGKPLDLLIAAEARAHGVPVAAYLANGNYGSTDWCRDVDLILTDSHATAQMYARTQGIKPVPVGAFIDPHPVVAAQHSRKHVLFINPSPQKGVGVVVRLAMMLEQRRPDIMFEVVESRGSWQEMLVAFSSALGTPRDRLDNVIVTPNTADMRPVYGRARLLLAPSLGWESSGRVLAEAMMNGIPALITDRGGMPEMIRDGGIKIQFPPQCYEKPYTTLPVEALLERVVEEIIHLYDDPPYYAAYAHKAKQVGASLHGLQANTQRLIDALAPCLPGGALHARMAAHAGQPAPALSVGNHDFDRLAPRLAQRKTPLVLVCGPWSSGTSATAGVVAALGLPAPGPYVDIDDPRTSSTHEMKAFQLLLQSLVSEQTLARLVAPPEMVRALTHFKNVTLPEALAQQGMNSERPVMLKHALASFILPEISQVFDLRLIVVTRPLAAIERTRLRRGWPAHYGQAGASQIYGNVFSYVVNSDLPYHIVRYPQLLAQPEEVIAALVKFVGVTPDTPSRLNALASLQRCGG